MCTGGGLFPHGFPRRPSWGILAPLARRVSVLAVRVGGTHYPVRAAFVFFHYSRRPSWGFLELVLGAYKRGATTDGFYLGGPDG